jgi:hypothetical protein
VWEDSAVQHPIPLYCSALQQSIPLPPACPPPPPPADYAPPLLLTQLEPRAAGKKLAAELMKTVASVESSIKIQGGKRKKTCFDASGKARLTLAEYLDRICKYTKCSDESLVLAMIYLDRLAVASEPVVLSSRTCYRLVFTSILVACKYHDGYDDDEWCSDPQFWSNVGGFPKNEVAKMEMEFMRLSNWKLLVVPQEFRGYFSLICLDEA